MANLAIKGHTTRGEEVIEILEMLGGENLGHFSGGETDLVYYIDRYNGRICCTNVEYSGNFYKLTLEEFLKKYPYKVGDWVQHNGATSCDSVFEVKDMKWEDETVKYIVKQLGCCCYGKEIKIAAEYLKPYKETYIKEGEKKSLLASLIEHFQTTPKDELEKEWNEHKELDEIGPTVEEYINFAESFKKQLKYPKTYKECCEVLDIESEWHLTFELNNFASCDLCINKEFEYVCKLEAFRKLLICRDAYWKIAGDEMGLGKPWEPEWQNTIKFCIESVYGSIESRAFNDIQHCILAFPTEEMIDNFYENFKDLIEECKELLWL